MCIIIITHNNAGTLRMALESLVNSELADRIIIVDNNSIDNSQSIIKEIMAEHPFVEGLFLKKNVGFAAGVNIGFKACGSAESYFALFNPDAIATRDWLKKLVEFMDENDSAGMAQSLLVKPNGEYDSAGGFVNGLGYPIEFRPGVGYELLRRVGPYEVGYAKGAAVLIRREAYLRVGGFDNRFFFYYDETDLSYRIRRAGWRIYVVPSSLVFHVGLGSRIPNKELFVLYYLERNHLLFLGKDIKSRLPPAMAWSLIGALHEHNSIRLKIRLRAIYDAIKLMLGHSVNDPINLSKNYY